MTRGGFANTKRLVNHRRRVIEGLCLDRKVYLKSKQGVNKEVKGGRELERATEIIQNREL